MRKEMMFLLPPMLLAAAWWFATTLIQPINNWWTGMLAYNWFSGLLGAILGALVGAFIVWITRILGTLAFGRLAMGLGDVHLMFGVGAIIGAAGATIAFFLAPFFGITIAIYMLLTGTRRELPYGPYLSLATAFVLLFSCRIMAWLTPGAMGLSFMVHELFRR
jgi:leader peptidase (prepilin peptidase)/N-methyltransferase